MFLAVALFMAGCGEPSKPERAKAERPVVTGVKVAPVNPSVLEETLEAVGTVRSRKQSVLSSKIVGNVIRIHANEGDRVRTGQLLAELDDRDVRAQLAKAEAGLIEAQHALEEVERAIQAAMQAVQAASAQKDLAASTLKRYQALFERRSVAPQEFDEVQAKLTMASAEVERALATKASLLAKKSQVLARIEQAKAEVANAKVFVGYTRITSPLNGVVVEKRVEVGNLAAPGVPLFTIEEERYRLEVAVQESEIGKLRVGQKAVVTIDALGEAGVNLSLPGSVVEIVPAADPMSRTFTVKIDLSLTAPPPTPPLSRGRERVGVVSGLYGRARFVIGSRQGLLVPREAVVERGQLVGVFVLGEGGIARFRLVKTGKTWGDRVEILSGLDGGEHVVVEGAGNLSDGSPVEVKG